MVSRRPGPAPVGGQKGTKAQSGRVTAHVQEAENRGAESKRRSVRSVRSVKWRLLLPTAGESQWNRIQVSCVCVMLCSAANGLIIPGSVWWGAAQVYFILLFKMFKLFKFSKVDAKCGFHTVSTAALCRFKLKTKYDCVLKISTFLRHDTKMQWIKNRVE